MQNLTVFITRLFRFQIARSTRHAPAESHSWTIIRSVIPTMAFPLSLRNRAAVPYPCAQQFSSKFSLLCVPTSRPTSVCMLFKSCSFTILDNYKTFTHIPVMVSCLTRKPLTNNFSIVFTHISSLYVVFVLVATHRQWWQTAHWASVLCSRPSSH